LLNAAVVALIKPLRRFWPLAAGLGGGVILLESSQGTLSSLISLSAAAAGLWLLSGRLRPSGKALPTSVEGWLERCQAVLDSFERLEADSDPLAQQICQLRIKWMRARARDRCQSNTRMCEGAKSYQTT